MAGELKRLGWKERDLERLPKTHVRKVALAARLRGETTMTISQIAARLRMGTRNTLSAKLHEWTKAHEKEKG